jgi:mRNA interferase YafQ
MLAIEYGAQFKRDYKRCCKKHLPMERLDEVIRLVAEDSPESRETLTQRHNMHLLQGEWRGSHECHVANAGNWLVIWASDEDVAFFQRTGTHDELFR